MEDIELTPAEMWVVKRLMLGFEADFAEAPPEIGARVRGSVIRSLLLGLPLPPGGGMPAALCLVPCGVLLRKAVIVGAIRLAEAAGAHGESACPPLVLHACQFEPEAGAGTSGDAADVDLRSARITRLALVECRLSFVDLRGVHIFGDLDVSGLGPRDEGGPCWVCAVGAVVDGSLVGDDACLRLPKDAGGGRTDRREYALNLRDATIGKSVLLGRVRVFGGMRAPRRVRGDVWLEGAELVAQQEHALKAQSMVVDGVVVLQPFRLGDRTYPFRAVGPITFHGARIGGMLALTGGELTALEGAPLGPLIECREVEVGGTVDLCGWDGSEGQPRSMRVAGHVDLRGARVRGDLTIVVVPTNRDAELWVQGLVAGSDMFVWDLQQSMHGRGLHAERELTVEAKSGSAPTVDLTNARVGSTIFLRGRFEQVAMWSIAGKDLVMPEEASVAKLMAKGSRFEDGVTIRGREVLDLTGFCCDHSVTLIADGSTERGLAVLADTVSVAKDLSVLGFCRYLSARRAQIGGKLDLQHTRLEAMSASGIRVGGLTLMPEHVLGALVLRGGTFRGGVTIGPDRNPTRLYARRVETGVSLGSLDFEDSRIVGDLKINGVVRQPANGLEVAVEEHPEWLRDADGVRMYRRSLECFENAGLLELHRSTDRVEAVGLLMSDDGRNVWLLNGESRGIYAANEALRLRLGTSAEVADYIRMFSGYVRGPDGAFVVMESLDDAPWMRRAAPTPAGDWQLQPLNPVPQGDDWECDATVAYGDAVFRCRFRVARSGSIEMVDDAPLARLEPRPFEYDQARRLYPVKVADGVPAEPWFPASGPWRAVTDQREFEESWNAIRKAMRIQATRIDDSSSLPVEVRLSGCRCDTLDDDDGQAWGPGVVGDLASFVYGDLGDDAGTAAREFPDGKPTRTTFGAQMAERRLAWLDRVMRDTRFNPRPYEHLVSVLNRRGDHEAARAAMLTRMRKENTAYRDTHRFRSMMICMFVDIPFQYGLFWRNALFTTGLYLLVGTVAFDVANHGVLRVPMGSPGSSAPAWNQGLAMPMAPVLVVDSRPVSDLAVLHEGRDVPAIMRPDPHSAVAQELPCGDQVESMVFALDLMVPMLDLNQEGKCQVSGRSGAFAWRVFSALYAVVGAYVTSMLILTISGVLRRTVER